MHRPEPPWWRKAWWTIFDKRRAAGWSIAVPAIMIIGYAAARAGGHPASVALPILGVLGLPIGIAHTLRRHRAISREEDAASARRRRRQPWRGEG